MRISREEANKRFGQIDKRFEQVNRRFEQIDKRFEQMDRRFNALQEEWRISREETNKRFEEMDRRFENLQDWVGIVVGGFQRRAGRNLEDAVAGTLRLALKRPDVKPENLKLRTKLIDDEGIIGQKIENMK